MIVASIAIAFKHGHTFGAPYPRLDPNHMASGSKLATVSLCSIFDALPMQEQDPSAD